MIVLPMSNQADYMEIKPHLRAGLTAHFVDHFDDVYSLAFGETGAPMLASSRGCEIVTVHTPLEEQLVPQPYTTQLLYAADSASAPAPDAA